MLFYVVIAVYLGSSMSAYVGQNDDPDPDVWAYQWYMDEQFNMRCNTSALHVQSNQFVKWVTPKNVTLEINEDGNSFRVSEKYGINGCELHIKKVTEETEGVYLCLVFNSADRVQVAKTLYGLNIHERKYHDTFDKYRHNLIVAVIATAVFLVPLLTIGFLYHFQYRTDEEKEKRQQMKAGGTRKFMYSANGHENAAMEKDSIAAYVRSTEGGGAYENPEADSQLSTQL